jgi:Uncharacterised nucleotidyltransferase
MDRRAALEDFAQRNRWLHRRAELDRAAVAVLERFEGAGVRSLLLKGPVLARLLYESEGAPRDYFDIDLLVGPPDLTKAREALAGLAYRWGYEKRGIDDVARVVHAELWAQRGEYGPLWVDLHRRLAGCQASDEIVWAALWGRRTSIEFAGRETTVLAEGGLALHLALHAAQGGPDEPKAIGDLARGIERWAPDVWRDAAELAEEVQGVAAFGAGLRLVPSGARLAELLELPSTPRLDWEVRHRQLRPRGAFHVQAVASARGLRERADLLRRSLLPTREWIVSEYHWAGRSRAHLLAGYARHLLRSPLWALRAPQFELRARRLRVRKRERRTS